MLPADKPVIAVVPTTLVRPDEILRDGVTVVTVAPAGTPVPVIAVPTLMFPRSVVLKPKISGVLLLLVSPVDVKPLTTDETVVLTGMPFPLTTMPGAIPVVDVRFEIVV